MNTRGMKPKLTETWQEPVDANGRGRRFFNRELSWLQFNWRVLEEARNPAHPLLERLRFLSISGSNLDEFYMVRVAGLRGQMVQGIDQRSIDGLTPAQQMASIEAEAAALMHEQQAQWCDLRRLLAEAHVQVLDQEALVHLDDPALLRYFRDQIFPEVNLNEGFIRIEEIEIVNIEK